MHKIYEEKAKGGYMKTSTNNRKKQFLALCLAGLMTSSIAGFAACNDTSSASSSSSSSPSTSQEKDEALITNSNFKTFDTNDGLNLIGTSVTGWTSAKGSSSSGTALSSKAASGILNTETEAWENLTTQKIENADKLTAEQAKEKWDTLTAKDKLLFQEAWEDANPDDDIEDELDFYQAFNIDSEDLPTCENPGTHDDAPDKNVLMIHNEYPTLNEYHYVGTAQSYTSSSTITVQAGVAAEFSVWVKTQDLKAASVNEDGAEAINKGAFIKVAQNVGGKTMPVFQVKNINTDGVEDNNGWKKYSFYLQSTSYTETTFTLTLGLGQGGGDDKWEHVNGYAFFDDIDCKIISREDYSAKTEALSDDVTFGFESTEEEKTVNAYTSNKDAFALNFYGEFSKINDFLNADNFTLGATTETSKRDTVYTVATGKYAVENSVVYPMPGINTDEDLLGIMTKTEMSATENEYLKQVYADFFENKDNNGFVADEESILLLMSASGASYTAKAGKTFSVPKGGYMALSFYVKTSDLNGFTGATITLHDGENSTAISSIDTTDIKTIDIDDTNKDLCDGWQQCLFYIQNDTDAEKTFTLSFNYGATSVLGKTLADYYAGFAAFTKFEEHVITDASEFEVATSGTYTSIVSLKGNETETSGDSGFDSVATVPDDKIENGLANPRNYKGVYANSAYINAEKYNDVKINQNANAGLLNKEYADNYTDLLKKLGGNSATWTSVFGNATQPLVIYNEGAQEHSYGFIGKSTSIAASTYATISLRVKVSANASAYIYLIDTDDNSYQNTLSIGRSVSYWYDDEGNVCSHNPSDHHFNEKTDVALKLQANGLYKVNPNWEFADSVANKDAYYANLAAYEVEANTNDLLIAENGVSYDYDNKWNSHGKNGKAFYSYNAENKTAYADSNKSVLVNDFSVLENLTARYEAIAENSLMFEVGATNGEWATVTFYVHTGDTAKNYRLEVWNGSRDDVAKNPDGSYVLVDSYKPTDVDETSFAKLIEERKEDVTEEDYFENAFSFYDSAKFLRYDETMDENGVGNSYENYLPSSYASNIAYLKYDSATTYELFADYSLAEVTVTPDAEEDTDTDTDEDDHDHGEEMNGWLLASSIAIAVILLAAMVSLIVQKSIRSYRKKHGIAPKVKKSTKKDHSDK